MKRPSRRDRPAETSPDTGLAVYDGRFFAGTILRRHDKYVARDPAGRELGHNFTTLRNAMRALPKAAAS